MFLFWIYELTNKGEISKPDLYIYTGDYCLTSDLESKLLSLRKSEDVKEVTIVNDNTRESEVDYGVKTDDEAHSTEWSGTYVNDWNTFVDANYQGTSVTSTTRSVVLDDAVNYAVARFDVSPKFKSDRLGEVPDNHNVYREIGNNFQLIGILVGQQNPVDYAFNFMTAEDAEIKTIYDASITATNITETAPSTPFRTLVLQSENGSSDEKKVNFALEFKNNGEDFYGVNGNLIPKGGTFYLVGSLSNYKDGTKSSDYVFQKDYYTTAKVTIASLKDAYNTVPDLRKTELELGLYVDLTWNKGLVGDVVIGE